MAFWRIALWAHVWRSGAGRVCCFGLRDLCICDLCGLVAVLGPPEANVGNSTYLGLW